MKTTFLACCFLVASFASNAATWSRTCTLWFNQVGANITPCGITNYFEPYHTSPLPTYKIFSNTWTASGETGLPHHHYTFETTCVTGSSYVFYDNHVTNPDSPAHTTTDCIFVQFVNYGIPYQIWNGGHGEQVGFTAYVRNALNGQYVCAEAFLWPGETWALWAVYFNWQRPDELTVRFIDSGTCTTYNCQPQNVLDYELFFGQ